MPQFHETMYGKRFFEGQLPKLINALQSIAESLEKLAEKQDKQAEEIISQNKE